jgi:hypothetical protein
MRKRYFYQNCRVSPDTAREGFLKSHQGVRIKIAHNLYNDLFYIQIVAGLIYKIIY